MGRHPDWQDYLRGCSWLALSARNFFIPVRVTRERGLLQKASEGYATSLYVAKNVEVKGMVINKAKAYGIVIKEVKEL